MASGVALMYTRYIWTVCGSLVIARASRSVFRLASADAWRSVYLSIHRSWIIRIGTGLRKCSFSRPDRRVTTSPASSSRRRCFMTPIRVMSTSDSSSLNVRPSRSKRRSSRKRRVGSASALKTRLSSTPQVYVTIWLPVKLPCGSDRSLALWIQNRFDHPDGHRTRHDEQSRNARQPGSGARPGRAATLR